MMKLKLYFFIFLVGIFLMITEVSSKTTYTDCSIYGNCQSAKPTQPSNASANGTTYHNLLSGLQGGIAGEFYHLTSAVYNWVTNNLNNFWTKNETIVANLSGSYGYKETQSLQDAYNNQNSIEGIKTLYTSSDHLLFNSGLSSIGFTGTFTETGASFVIGGFANPIFRISNQMGTLVTECKTWWPLADATYDLGGVNVLPGESRRWRDLYLSGTIKGQSSFTNQSKLSLSSEGIIRSSLSEFSTNTTNIVMASINGTAGNAQFSNVTINNSICDANSGSCYNLTTLNATTSLTNYYTKTQTDTNFSLYYQLSNPSGFLNISNMTFLSTNVAYKNQSNIFNSVQNFTIINSTNITNTGKFCFVANCSKYMWYNGSNVVIKG